MEWSESKEYLVGEVQERFPHGHPAFVTLLMNIAELHSNKNKEYVGGGSPIQNFLNVSELAGISPQRVAWTYALKHIDAVSSQLRDPRDASLTSFDERLMDIAVYCLLMILLPNETLDFVDGPTTDMPQCDDLRAEIPDKPPTTKTTFDYQERHK